MKNVAFTLETPLLYAEIYIRLSSTVIPLERSCNSKHRQKKARGFFFLMSELIILGLFPK